MKMRLLNSFREIYADENNLSSYKNYYCALRTWVKKNANYFRDRLWKNERLMILLDLDVDKYLVDNPGIIWAMEKGKICGMNFKRDEELLMIISDILWDMVTVFSDLNCSCCDDCNLRYVKMEAERGNTELLLECGTCGFVFHVDGSRYQGGIKTLYPASKKEIAACL